MRHKQYKRLLGLCLILAFTYGNQVMADTALNIKVNGISEFQNNESLYIMLVTVNNVNAAKYRIERQVQGKPESRIQLAELTYAEMKQAGFRYFDLVGLKKHGSYKYLISTFDAEENCLDTAVAYGVVENIRYHGKMQDFAPIFTQNNATFTLGPKVDPENETLEYRLSVRLPGGGGEKVLKTWLPQRDREQVLVNIPETCEWKLSCIETDGTIPDRYESILVNWTLFVAK